METDAPSGSFGALVISLDFELRWGVRETRAMDGPYRKNLLGARAAVPRLLRLFQEFDVAATWATVGFLFARTEEELRRFAPECRPAYASWHLDPFHEKVGRDEDDDPLHYAASLIAAIRHTPRQEVATHTFSHYYCLDPGHSRASFASDLRSALAIARESGVSLHSIVFPRNQHNAEYDSLLIESGIKAYRGNPRSFLYSATPTAADNRLRRIGRLLDSHIGAAGPRTIRWVEMLQENGLCDVRASHFLRPVPRRLSRLAVLQQGRIVQSLRRAATAGEVVHLWWHPHNFGVRLEENLCQLRSILEIFRRLREQDGMRSLTMAEAASIARGIV